MTTRDVVSSDDMKIRQIFTRKAMQALCQIRGRDLGASPNYLKHSTELRYNFLAHVCGKTEGQIYIVLQPERSKFRGSRPI